MSKNEKAKNGFTLTEMLVSMSVFSLVLVAIAGIFVSAVRTQKRALSAREVSGQTSYLAEHISRALRMARKDMDGSCIPLKTNYYVTDTATTTLVKFRNYNNECQEFYLNKTAYQLMERIGTGTSTPLTSPNLRVNYFNVNLLGPDQPPTDYQQPRVTIAIETITTSSSPLKLQITVSQRQLDFAY